MSMRIAYGFCRSVDDFADANLTLDSKGQPKVYIDDKATNRAELADMLGTAVYPSVTVVVLAEGDMGKGFALTVAKVALDAAGAVLEVLEQPAPEPRKPGPKPTFTPTAEQRAELVKFWHKPHLYPGPFALAKCREIMGDWVQRHHLYTHLGKREQ